MSAIALPPPALSPTLLTGEEFLERYSNERVELVRGIVVELPMPVPGARHGVICMRIGRFLANFVDEHNLGEVAGNDSAVRTERDPDTVRGADVAYYSYARMPKGTVPVGIPDVRPDLAVEVRSPSDSWTDIFGKVGEYLAAGVRVVIVIDDDQRTASVYRPGGGQEIFTDTDTLTVPEILPGFSVPVARLFP